MTRDFEAEYNNRARVPSHPAIIEGWMRDAAAYRAANPPEILAYGPGERQVIHLFSPAAPSAGTVLFIHGGYWQALHPQAFSHLARGLVERGFTVALPGYDLCPAVDVGTIVDQMIAAALHLARAGHGSLVATGHSAGGHLAACLTAADWPSLAPDLPEPPVRAGYAISGLFDLAPLLATSINGALRLDSESAARLSPIRWRAPAGAAFDAVVGGEESAEYHRQSRDLAAVWGAAGVATRCDALRGFNHFTVIAPLADPTSAMVARIGALAGQASSRGRAGMA